MSYWIVWCYTMVVCVPVGNNVFNWFFLVLFYIWIYFLPLHLILQRFSAACPLLYCFYFYTNESILISWNRLYEIIDLAIWFLYHPRGFCWQAVKNLKRKVFDSYILPVVTYGAETLTYEKKVCTLNWEGISL